MTSTSERSHFRRPRPPRIAGRFHRLLPAAALSICLAIPRCAAGEPEVDESIVLRVGDHEVSRYILQRNYRRWVQQGARSESEKKHWFQIWMAKQVLLADARAHHYDIRSEVEVAVDTMSRHMVASPNGPVLRMLVPPAPLDYLATKDAADARNHRRQEIARVCDELLDSIHFSINDDQCISWARHLDQLNDASGAGLGLWSSDHTSELASYESTGRHEIVTPASWARWVTKQYVRKFPSDAEGLRASLRNMVEAEALWIEGARLGCMENAEFKQNQESFRQAQILDLYEREKLLPNLPLHEEDIERYYRDHASRFSRPTQVVGVMHRFVDTVAANAWIRNSLPSPIRTVWPIETRDVTISEQMPLLGRADLTAAILRVPPNQPFGPVATSDGAVVFVCRSVRMEPVPLNQAEPQLRAILNRERLDAESTRVAPELAKHYRVEDKLLSSDLDELDIRRPRTDAASHAATRHQMAGAE